jgi:hypothetical protein
MGETSSQAPRGAAYMGHACASCGEVRAMGGDRTFKLASGITSEYGRHVESFGEPRRGNPQFRVSLEVVNDAYSKCASNALYSCVSIPLRKLCAEYPHPFSIA